ncbi:MAG: hypothetical protein JWO30_4045 [Fibrobacteres bacterium]|nr:hypothetical protein [Fibrobacterota bacterium]
MFHRLPNLQRSRLQMAIQSRLSIPAAIGARLLFACAALSFLMGPPASAAVDPSTLEGKVLFGYQGWFGCPGTWGGSWSHWGGGPPTAGNVAVDMYPDLSDFNKADLCTAPGFTVGASPSYFFSARNPKVVDMHFKWMQDYGLDGVLIQRFVGDIPGLKSQGDLVLKNILASSAKYGRVVAIEYDVTGSNFSTWSKNIQDDWKYLVDQIKITNQANYLHHKGKPLVSVWGVGLNESRNPPTNPAEALALVDWFHTGATAPYQASIMGGVPRGFRTLNGDARTDPAWLNVYKAMDAVQPWNIGRYSAVSQIKTTFKTTAAADQKWLNDAGVLYMPSIFPGYSQSNAIRPTKKPNEIPRMGGDFIWQQAMAAKSAGAGAVKIAMFDEVNEATAMFKVVSKRSEAPSQGYWLALDGDGKDLPSDWYLRLSSEITQITHGAKTASDVIPIKPEDPFTLAIQRGNVQAAGKRLQWNRVADGIRFQLGGYTGTVTISDMRGSRVRTLNVVAGSATWDSRDAGQAMVPAGLYLARVEGGADAAIENAMIPVSR